LMDSQFPIFFNEVDWCYRAKRELGWRIYYTPEVTVTHFGGASTKQVKERMVRESHQSLIRFYEKHYRKSISPMLFSIITKAVAWNEKRIIGGIRPARGAHAESAAPR
jgi:GT2 family glycosyltransferase